LSIAIIGAVGGIASIIALFLIFFPPFPDEPVNELPIPSIQKSPGPYLTNNIIEFSGSNSRDPDGEIVNYEWTFGDGTSDIGESVTHKYSKSGTYNISLRVTDNDGAEVPKDDDIVILSDGPPVLDKDRDGIEDKDDNCPTIYNPNQEDENQNNVGDVCEPIGSDSELISWHSGWTKFDKPLKFEESGVNYEKIGNDALKVDFILKGAESKKLYLAGLILLYDDISQCHPSFGQYRAEYCGIWGHEQNSPRPGTHVKIDTIETDRNGNGFVSMKAVNIHPGEYKIGFWIKEKNDILSNVIFQTMDPYGFEYTPFHFE